MPGFLRLKLGVSARTCGVARMRFWRGGEGEAGNGASGTARMVKTFQELDERNGAIGRD